jgi:Leucine-rich repeat (LRR) protein
MLISLKSLFFPTDRPRGCSNANETANHVPPKVGVRSEEATLRETPADLTKVKTPDSASIELDGLSPFKTALDRWVAEPVDSGEQRQEAANRILKCEKNQETQLDLSNLYLTTLPDVFGWLGQLNALNFLNNCLKSLPDSIGGLQNLQVFSFGGNPLESLPETFAQLKNLKEVHVVCMQQLATFAGSRMNTFRRIKADPVAKMK